MDGVLSRLSGAALGQAPDSFRGGGHRHVFHAEGIGEGIDEGRGRTDRAGFAAALPPSGLCVQGVPWVLTVKLSGSSARGIVWSMYEPVQQLARLVVVHGAFEQRLAQTLGDAAVYLAFDDHRIDDVAEVVDRDELNDRGLAGFRIDLDLAHIRAGRIREVGRIVEAFSFRPGSSLSSR